MVVKGYDDYNAVCNFVRADEGAIVLYTTEGGVTRVSTLGPWTAKDRCKDPHGLLLGPRNMGPKKMLLLHYTTIMLDTNV
jgi:hypothetical protein